MKLDMVTRELEARERYLRRVADEALEQGGVDFETEARLQEVKSCMKLLSEETKRR